MTNSILIPNYVSKLLSLPVDVQYGLAKKLAANCGYKLVAENNERSLKIKELIKCIKYSNSFEETELALVIEGLEKLL